MVYDWTQPGIGWRYSGLQFVNGAETRTLVTTLDLNTPIHRNFELQPFDEIVVRSAAEFELIQNVRLEGEVRYPGLYALLDDNERLTDVIRTGRRVNGRGFSRRGDPGAALRQ